jgi:hypothetical protein
MIYQENSRFLINFHTLMIFSHNRYRPVLTATAPLPITVTVPLLSSNRELS